MRCTCFTASSWLLNINGCYYPRPKEGLIKEELFQFHVWSFANFGRICPSISDLSWWFSCVLDAIGCPLSSFHRLVFIIVFGVLFCLVMAVVGYPLDFVPCRGEIWQDPMYIAPTSSEPRFCLMPARGVVWFCTSSARNKLSVVELGLRAIYSAQM